MLRIVRLSGALLFLYVAVSVMILRHLDAGIMPRAIEGEYLVLVSPASVSDIQLTELRLELERQLKSRLTSSYYGVFEEIPYVQELNWADASIGILHIQVHTTVPSEILLKVLPSILKYDSVEQNQWLSPIEPIEETPRFETAWNFFRPLQLPLNDPEFSKQWGLFNYGQKDALGQVGLSGADIGLYRMMMSNLELTNKTRVAVVDSGVAQGHPDLQSGLFKNLAEIPANNLDDDLNGYVDDVNGWNSMLSNGNVEDDLGHGTHCAGIIAASQNNKLGVSGINAMTEVIPIRTMNGKQSGSMLSLVNAFQYVKAIRARVVNVSWGTAKDSEVLRRIFSSMESEKILVVAAAGNDGVDLDRAPVFPASYLYANIVTVGASDNKDGLAQFSGSTVLSSNYGQKTVHLVAPGRQILSTFLRDDYKFLSGTSMAAPYVAGAAAALWSYDPSLTSDQVKSLLIRNTDVNPMLQGKTVSGGRLSLYKAMKELAHLP